MQSDEQPQEEPQEEPTVRPIHWTQHVLFAVEGAWPERTSFGPDFLKHPHTRHAAIDGDAVTFRTGNGHAVYRLRRDLPQDGENVVADLVEGTKPADHARRARKFDLAVGD
jgi:hypothetical protein